MLLEIGLKPEHYYDSSMEDLNFDTDTNMFVNEARKGFINGQNYPFVLYD